MNHIVFKWYKLNPFGIVAHCNCIRKSVVIFYYKFCHNMIRNFIKTDRISKGFKRKIYDWLLSLLYIYIFGYTFKNRNMIEWPYNVYKYYRIIYIYIWQIDAIIFTYNRKTNVLIFFINILLKFITIFFYIYNCHRLILSIYARNIY